MRGSLILSFAAHSALLIASVVALPAAKPLRVEEPPPVPVEILSFDEFTKLTSKKTEKVVEKPVPKPPEPEKKPAKKPKPKTPPKAVERPEPVEPVAEPQTVAAIISQLPEPAPVPAPKPEPAPPPEPVAKPKPAPPPEPVAKALPKVEPKPEPKPVPVAQPAPPKPKAEPKKPVTTATSPPSPRVKPKPPKKVAKKRPKKPKRKKPKKPKFNADRIAALLNKLPDDPSAAPVETGGRVAKSKLRVAGLDQRVTRSEMEYLRQQISRCWSPPVAVAGAENLAVRVKLSLRRDGSLAGAPIVLNTGPTGFRIAAEAAVRAVNECEPFDMPGEKFDAWAEVIINFDPRFMLGG